MFADDTNLFISDPNIENIFETMNEELRQLANWFKSQQAFFEYFQNKIFFVSFYKKKKTYTKYLTSIAH